MKKKILFLITSLQFGGGAEKNISLLANELNEKYDISIITFSSFKNDYKFKGKYYSLRENDTKLKRILIFFKLHEILRLIKIYRLIRSISPDIIISFLEFTNIPTIITKILFQIKVPLIISIRTNPKLGYKNKNRFLNFVIKRIYPLKAVNEIITVSKGVKKILEKYYQIEKSKIKHIYNGIERERINQLKGEKIVAHKDVFNDDNVFKFITIGRLSEEKGHIYLLKAFMKVKKMLPNSKLIIIGEGELRNQLEHFIMNNSLSTDVLLMGLISNPYCFLAKSDIFVFSSLYEGFPNVIVDALACGLPIISTDCMVGPQEILDNGKYGILVKVMDSDDLAEKMIFLAENPSIMKDFADMAINRSKFFNLQKTIKKWDNIIESHL